MPKIAQWFEKDPIDFVERVEDVEGVLEDRLDLAAKRSALLPSHRIKFGAL